MISYLVDTHVLLWAAGSPERLSERARSVLEDHETDVWFSVVAIWEVAIKVALGRADFAVDPQLFRRGLLEAGYLELAISGEHAAGAAYLEPIHRDPFDRLLVAQARQSGLVLLTSDTTVARYSGSIELV